MKMVGFNRDYRPFRPDGQQYSDDPTVQCVESAKAAQALLYRPFSSLSTSPTLLVSTSTSYRIPHPPLPSRKSEDARTRQPAEDAIRQNLGRPSHVRPAPSVLAAACAPAACVPRLTNAPPRVCSDVDENGQGLIYIDRCVHMLLISRASYGTLTQRRVAATWSMK